MRFHEYKLLKNSNHFSADFSAFALRQFYDTAISNMTNNGASEVRAQYGNLFLAERFWIEENRPFYHVYPAVVDALKNTSLHVKPSMITMPRLSIVAVCFAEGHEVHLPNGIVRSFLLEVTSRSHVLGESTVEDCPMLRITLDRLNKGRDCFSCFVLSSDDYIDATTTDPKVAEKKQLLSLAVGVSLLAQDEEFAEPVLLSRDANRHFDTKQQYDDAVARAVRRGRIGYTIGKGIEVSPHVRRPHFGIRWTGKNAAVPKLVPIKGAMINRSKLFPIPTGYMGCDE